MNDDIWKSQFLNLCQGMGAFKKECEVRQEPFADANDLKSGIRSFIGGIVGDEGVDTFISLMVIDAKAVEKNTQNELVLKSLILQSMDISKGFKLSCLVYPAYVKVNTTLP